MKMIAVLIALFLYGCVQQPAPTATPSTTATAAPTATPSAAATNVVEIAASGFSPSSITINAGDTVTFVNRDSAKHWPASAVHPTHSAYPEPGGCIGSKFDACRGLSQGESFAFTFTHVGTWKYHDHLNPTTTGTVVVR
jgi:plastocyanin